ncbi:hypothetical protein Lsha_1986 [Legionella shakespearei DSM 23087]|uniref:Uncharacterized protein n=1 Tax=Legionella shakespearei DSM 23087 TaxID=1122169 RepID=A0A0W0YQZ8_9GAMM|nr:hypothetical protein Lsha_1986 [Legionella shakespearei DSM 23087]
MGLRELLDRLDNTPVLPVPSIRVFEGTDLDLLCEEGSLCSLCSFNISTNQKDSLENTTNMNEIKALCECGYRRPFCTCRFYNLPM